MSLAVQPEPSQPLVPSRYRVHLLSEPKPTERGVVYRRGDEHFLLAWGRVKRVLVAEIGEPGEASTVVFDLAVETTGPECVVCRLDAAPGETARRLARALSLGLGGEVDSTSLKPLVDSGTTSVRHRDVDTFEAAALEAVRFGAGDDAR